MNSLKSKFIKKKLFKFDHAKLNYTIVFKYLAVQLSALILILINKVFSIR